MGRVIFGKGGGGGGEEKGKEGRSGDIVEVNFPVARVPRQGKDSAEQGGWLLRGKRGEKGERRRGRVLHLPAVPPARNKSRDGGVSRLTNRDGGKRKEGQRPSPQPSLPAKGKTCENFMFTLAPQMKREGGEKGGKKEGRLRPRPSLPSYLRPVRAGKYRKTDEGKRERFARSNRRGEGGKKKKGGKGKASARMMPPISKVFWRMVAPR